MACAADVLAWKPKILVKTLTWVSHLLTQE